ncbi:MAG: hypothetical protein GX182_02865 [Firmicutes bacterium]|nr:hypothetical protein [Bacillota bacterium]
MAEVDKEVVETHPTSISIVSVPDEVDAGADMALRINVSCPSGCDLGGTTLKIVDSQGNGIAEAVLPPPEEAGNEIAFTVKAPAEPGEYKWAVSALPQAMEEISHEGSSAEFSFTVKLHTISLSVWGVSSPIGRGEKLKVTVGGACSANCSLAGLPFSIEDAEGEQVAAGELGEEVLPQTKGVYWTELELDAPMEQGVHKWVVKCNPTDLEMPHQWKPCEFAFRTTMPPEHTVTVQVFDLYTELPLEDANVMVGLFRATTNEEGIAVLRAAGGKQDLCVSKQGYDFFQTSVDITGDETIKVELMLASLM